MGPALFDNVCETHLYRSLGLHRLVSDDNVDGHGVLSTAVDGSDSVLSRVVTSHWTDDQLGEVLRVVDGHRL